MTSTQPKPADTAETTATDDAGNSRFEMLRLTAISAHPKNVRATINDLGGLADSIRAQGVLQPVVVAPAKAKNKFVVIMGHRRHAAAKAAGLKEIPAFVREDLVSEADQIEAMLTENLQRADLNPIEEGDGYQTLLDLGVTVKDLSSRVGTTQKRIRERMKLSAAPSELRDRISTRQVTIDDALALQSFADDADIYAELQKSLGTPNWDWAVARAKEQRTRKQRYDKTVKELTADGVTVITRDTMIETRQHLSEQAGQTLGWKKEETRPDDAATNPLVAALVITEVYGPGTPNVYWYRAVPEAEVTPPGPVGNTGGTSTPPASSTTPTAEPDAEAPADPAVAEKLAADTAEREAVKARTEQLKADLATAATVRLDHLKSFLFLSPSELRDGAAGSARRAFLDSVKDDEMTWADVADVLRLEHYDAEKPTWKQDDEALGNELTVWLASAPLEYVVFAHRVCKQRYVDRLTLEPVNWERAGDVNGWVKSWIDELTDVHGYELSDVEASLYGHLTEE